MGKVKCTWVLAFLLFTPSLSNASLGLDLLATGYESGFNLRTHAYYLMGSDLQMGPVIASDQLQKNVNELFAGFAFVYGKTSFFELDLGYVQRDAKNFFVILRELDLELILGLVFHSAKIFAFLSLSLLVD